MAYESKIYIVKKSNFVEVNGMRYARVIAMFDLCKFPSLSDVLRNMPKTDCYFYNGDTEVLEDNYGEPLTETTVETVINVLEKVVEYGETYYRIFPLLSMLKTIYEQQKNGEWGNITVLHYGY